MLKNFWKIAIRQLGKQKFYSAVKIGGFALGIAACLLIGLYIHNQLSYDRDFPGAGRLYRLTRVSEREWNDPQGIWLAGALCASPENRISPGGADRPVNVDHFVYWCRQ